MRKHNHPANRTLVIALLACLSFMLVAGSTSSVYGAYPARQSGPTGAAPVTSPSTIQPPQSLVLKVYFRSMAERDSLAAEFGAEEAPTLNGFLLFWTTQDIYAELLNRGLRVEIDKKLTDEVNSIHFGHNDGETFYGGYYTVEEMQTFLDQKVTDNPTLAEKVDVGDSWCKTHIGTCTQPTPYNGYDLWALHITNQSIPGPKPVFWFDAGIHSREIATPELAMRLISWLLDNYNTVADARWLVDYHDIWIMPMFNPDGHHIVESGGGGSSPYYQRKNANKLNGCTTWPPTTSNQFGTDLNRNFPFLWNCCGGSSSSVCGETYHGPSAGSDQETQDVTAKIRTLIPDQRGPLNSDAAPITTTGVYQNMHSYANLNLYPWGWTTTVAPNGADLRNIAAHMSATNAGGNGYTYCQPPSCLYAVDGDALGWAYGELGAAGFTTELEGGSFLPPFSQVAAIWNNNKGMLTYLAKIARTPYLTTRGPDTNNVVTTPMTVTQGTPSHLTATSNYAWTGNTYSQNLAAAEYYIDTPPWSGGTPLAMTAVDGTFNSPTEAVQADVDTSALSPGRHILLVRGRGVNSYSGYESWGPVSATFLDVLGPAGSPTPTSPVSPSATPTRTNTPGASTSTSTRQPSATNTRQPSVTNTPNGNPSPTQTQSGQSTATPTNQPGATDTPGSNPTATATSQPAATNTPGATPTLCPINFSDVHPSDYFYVPVQYLFCRNVISGYGTEFRPYNNTSRGQLTKIVVLGFNLAINTAGGPHFTDVPTSNVFYPYVETAYSRGIVNGYGTEFRPNDNVSRGQLCKIVVLAAGWDVNTAGGPHFTDVPVGSTFYTHVETAYNHGIISGYGSLFKPNDPATRGQISKIVYLAVTTP